MPSYPTAIIVNPASGFGAGAAIASYLRACENDTFTTYEIASLPSLDLGAFRYVIVCGGDGTFTSVISKAVLTGTHPIIIPAPLGTANDLAREVRSPRIRSNEQVVALVQNAPLLDPTPLTVWELRWGKGDDHRIPFTNYFSIGFDAEVVRDFSSWRMARKSTVLRNRIQYALSGARHLRDTLPVLTISSRGFSTTLQGGISLLFSNIRSILGFGSTHPSCDYSDDLLEALTLPNLFSYLKLMPPFGSIFGPPELLGRKASWTISGPLAGLPIQID